jgi:hypothetical protein
MLFIGTPCDKFRVACCIQVYWTRRGAVHKVCAKAAFQSLGANSSVLLAVALAVPQMNTLIILREL